MRVADILSLSTRMFKTRPMRTFLTILGVSVGIGAVLFLVSLGYGLQDLILSRITTADSLLSLDVTADTSDLISLDKKSIEEIAMMPEVVEISPVVSLSGQISYNNFTGDGMVNIADPNFFRLSGVSLARGSFYDDPEDYEIIISSAGVKLFNTEVEKIIGKKISLSLFVPKETAEEFEEVEIAKLENDYTVVGVIEDENTNYVYVPSNAISGLGINKYNQLKVKVASNENMGVVRDAVLSMGYLVSSLSDTITQTKKIFRIIQIILALFGLVALVVSAIGMFNTMTIALLERTNEIGIMRAIGVRKSDIRKLFLFESVVMGFLGGVGGIIVGYSAGELANIGINILARNFGGQALDLFYRPLWFILFILVFSTIIGFITGIYPSNRAAKLNPLDALRYK